MAETVRKMTHCEDELHEIAVGQTGFTDFGDPSYRQGLRAQLRHYDDHLKLTRSGWTAACEQIVRILVSRLHTQHGWLEHPDVLSNPIHEPLVIIGLTRTGSTALHRLLSSDPQFQGLEYWLTQTPMIRPPRETWNSCSQYRDCVAYLEDRYARTPSLRGAHEFVAGEVEECVEVLAQSFASWLPQSESDSPAIRESYHRYADVLRLIGGRESSKRWLLKCPHHTLYIDTLLQLFPDARIVQTHRDPLKAIPSLCSIVHMRNQILEGDSARSDALGPQWCAYWRTALDRLHVARLNRPTQFFDVEHRDLVADPLGTVRSIYSYFDLELSAETETRMQAWLQTRSTSRDRGHLYDIEAWGITSADICQLFSDYRTQHGFA